MNNIFLKISTCLLISFLVSNNTSAQTTPKETETPYIELSGIAELEVVPDILYINFSIKEKTINKVKMSVEDQEKNIINALVQLNINQKNLSLADANAEYTRVKWNKEVVSSKSYSLLVNNTKTLAYVFQVLDSLDINDANLGKISHTKIDSLKKEVRIMAIKSAKNKADYLLAAIGEQCGKPIIVREISASANVESFNPYRGNVYKANTSNWASSDEYSKEQEDITFKKIKIHSEIYVKFQIK